MDLALLQLCGWRLEESGTIMVKLYCPQCTIIIHDTPRALAIADTLSVSVDGRVFDYDESALAIHVFNHTFDGYGTLYKNEMAKALLHLVEVHKDLTAMSRSRHPESAVLFLRSMATLMQVWAPEASDVLASLTSAGTPEPEPEINPQVSRNKAAEALSRSRSILRDLRRSCHQSWHHRIDGALHAIAKAVK